MPKTFLYSLSILSLSLLTGLRPMESFCGDTEENTQDVFGEISIMRFCTKASFLPEINRHFCQRNIALSMTDDNLKHTFS